MELWDISKKNFETHSNDFKKNNELFRNSNSHIYTKIIFLLPILGLQGYKMGDNR